MGTRKRKQTQKHPNGDTDSAQHTPKNKSHHVDTSKEVQDAITTLSNSLPKNATLEVRNPTLSRNPSVGEYLHKALFITEAEAQQRRQMPPGARRRVILLLGIFIGMFLAMFLMRQTNDVDYMDYMEAFSHYFQDFDLASMVPTGMIPEEFIGNMSALFRPDILTEDAFHPGEELRQLHGYKPKYPVRTCRNCLHCRMWNL
jgi:hypothetical protein